MARRARPSHKLTQSTAAQHENSQQSRAQVAKQARPKAIDFLSEPEGAPSELARSTVARDSDDGDGTNGDSDRDEYIDAPRVSQWIDDEELELQEQTHASVSLDSEESDDSGGGHTAGEPGPLRRLRSLEDDLSTLPLGTLRSAQRSLARAQALNDAGSDSEERSEGEFSASEDDGPFPHLAKGKPDQLSKPKNDLAKRANKHAPVEMSSKRPMSRRRVVVDDKFPRPRDPRFMHAAGRYDPSKFKQQYDFLSGLRDGELLTLREHVKRARKLLASSPSHLRAEREEEVKRLEHAVKRVESAVSLDNRERVELKALHSAKKVEEEKRKKGKTSWWMKRPEKRALLAKARLDAIASVGGKQAVKKAVAKKQRKISQKEKKMRPFLQGEETEWPNGKRRRPVGSIGSGSQVKRRKVV